MDVYDMDTRDYHGILIEQLGIPLTSRHHSQQDLSMRIQWLASHARNQDTLFTYYTIIYDTASAETTQTTIRNAQGTAMNSLAQCGHAQLWPVDGSSSPVTRTKTVESACVDSTRASSASNTAGEAMVMRRNAFATDMWVKATTIVCEPMQNRSYKVPVGVGSAVDDSWHELEWTDDGHDDVVMDVTVPDVPKDKGRNVKPKPQPKPVSAPVPAPIPQHTEDFTFDDGFDVLSDIAVPTLPTAGHGNHGTGNSGVYNALPLPTQGIPLATRFAIPNEAGNTCATGQVFAGIPMVVPLGLPVQTSERSPVVGIPLSFPVPGPQDGHNSGLPKSQSRRHFQFSDGVGESTSAGSTTSERQPLKKVHALERGVSYPDMPAIKFTQQVPSVPTTYPDIGRDKAETTVYPSIPSNTTGDNGKKPKKELPDVLSYCKHTPLLPVTIDVPHSVSEPLVMPSNMDTVLHRLSALETMVTPSSEPPPDTKDREDDDNHEIDGSTHVELATDLPLGDDSGKMDGDDVENDGKLSGIDDGEVDGIPSGVEIAPTPEEVAESLRKVQAAEQTLIKREKKQEATVLAETEQEIQNVDELSRRIHQILTGQTARGRERAREMQDKRAQRDVDRAQRVANHLKAKLHDAQAKLEASRHLSGHQRSKSDGGSAEYDVDDDDDGEGDS